MIVLTRGPKRSCLADVVSGEVRYMETADLPPDMKDDQEADNLGDPYQDNCALEILDIHMHAGADQEGWQDLLQDFTSVTNIRILYHAESVPVRFVQQILDYLYQNVMTFGVIILNYSKTPTEVLSPQFPNLRVIKGSTTLEKGYHKPQFWSNGPQFNLSGQHNPYHYSRYSTYLGREVPISHSHDIYDIPKQEIEVCKDCEMRRLCYDPRKPQKTKMGYTYDNPCAYDPYRATWHIAMDEVTTR